MGGGLPDGGVGVLGGALIGNDTRVPFSPARVSHLSGLENRPMVGRIGSVGGSVGGDGGGRLFDNVVSF